MSDNPPENTLYSIARTADGWDYHIPELPPDVDSFPIPDGLSVHQRNALLVFAHNFRTRESLESAWTCEVWQHKATGVMYHVWRVRHTTHLTTVYPGGYMNH